MKKQFLIKNPHIINNVNSFLNQNYQGVLNSGEVLEVNICFYKSKRNLEQNKRLHAMLQELEFNHKEPVIAQFDYYRRHPQSWTANDAFGDIQVIDDDVLWWSELPEAPKNPPFNVWLDWEYTPENPYPKLDGDPLVHVRFGDLSESNIERGIDARPISYWHGNDDDANDFEWLNDSKVGYKPTDNCIIAYMLVDPNNHD